MNIKVKQALSSWFFSARFEGKRVLWHVCVTYFSILL